MGDECWGMEKEMRYNLVRNGGYGLRDREGQHCQPRTGCEMRLVDGEEDAVQQESEFELRDREASTASQGRRRDLMGAQHVA